MYGIEGRKKKDHKDFQKSRDKEAEKNDGYFNFREQLMSYCSNDVTVIRLCALKFRKDFIFLCNVDPYKSVTIAAACQV